MLGFKRTRRECAMKKISLAVSLIRNNSNQTVRWLARMNESTKRLEFVIARRLEEESYREAAIREVAWELRLDRKRDFLVSNMAQINLEFIDRMPGSYSKAYVNVSFYNVEIYRRDVLEEIDADPLNLWVTSEEICNGVTRCGRQFSQIVPYLINRSNVIQYWESSQPIDGAQ